MPIYIYDGEFTTGWDDSGQTPLVEHHTNLKGFLSDLWLICFPSHAISIRMVTWFERPFFSRNLAERGNLTFHEPMIVWVDYFLWATTIAFLIDFLQIFCSTSRIPSVLPHESYTVAFFKKNVLNNYRKDWLNPYGMFVSPNCNINQPLSKQINSNMNQRDHSSR